MTTRRLPRRFAQLLIGLWLYGATMAFMIESGLGLDPWDVFHEGLTIHVPLSFGAVTAIVGVAVLLAWIPLRQKPGIGTVLNVVVIAISVDVTLAWLPHAANTAVALPMLAIGVIGNGLAGALYVSADLGPGPRDGLWVAIVARSGLTVRLVRTSIEVLVLVTGFILGGTVGLGTIVYALAIGPVVQFFLPLVKIERPPSDGPGQPFDGNSAATASNAA
ncbi:MAG: hypothetical protein Q7T55_17755 [Solirubrobacteraceae bacterium]|nr:hypothetical protein [Solirubrobacteraceae bacterium]